MNKNNDLSGNLLGSEAGSAARAMTCDTASLTATATFF
jgi:hypothetical protein